MGFDNDAATFGLVVKQADDIIDVFGTVSGAHGLGIVAGQFEQALGDVDAFDQLFVYHLQIFFLFAFLSARVEFIEHAFDNHTDGAEMVFHLMGDGSGQKTEGKQFLLVRKANIVAQVADGGDDQGFFLTAVVGNMKGSGIDGEVVSRRVAELLDAAEIALSVVNDFFNRAAEIGAHIVPAVVESIAFVLGAAFAGVYLAVVFFVGDGDGSVRTQNADAVGNAVDERLEKFFAAFGFNRVIFNIGNHLIENRG